MFKKYIVDNIFKCCKVGTDGFIFFSNIEKKFGVICSEYIKYVYSKIREDYFFVTTPKGYELPFWIGFIKDNYIKVTIPSEVGSLSIQDHNIVLNIIKEGIEDIENIYLSDRGGMPLAYIDINIYRDFFDYYTNKVSINLNSKLFGCKSKDYKVLYYSYLYRNCELEAEHIKRYSVDSNFIKFIAVYANVFKSKVETQVISIEGVVVSLLYIINIDKNIILHTMLLNHSVSYRKYSLGVITHLKGIEYAIHLKATSVVCGAYLEYKKPLGFDILRLPSYVLSEDFINNAPDDIRYKLIPVNTGNIYSSIN